MRIRTSLATGTGRDGTGRILESGNESGRVRQAGLTLAAPLGLPTHLLAGQGPSSARSPASPGVLAGMRASEKEKRVMNPTTEEPTAEADGQQPTTTRGPSKTLSKIDRALARLESLGYVVIRSPQGWRLHVGSAYAPPVLNTEHQAVLIEWASSALPADELRARLSAPVRPA